MSASDNVFPSRLRTRLTNVLSSRPVGLLAGGTFLSIILGCMSLSIGCRTEPEGTICQKGTTSLHAGQEVDVYYPAPYPSPPNLELSGDTENCEIIEQKSDHFRIRYKGTGEACPHWQARGLRGVPFVAPPTVAVPPPAPPPPTDDSANTLPLPKAASNP